MEEERIGSVYRVRGGWAYGLEDSGHRSGGGGGFTREDAARDLLVLWLRDQGLIGEPERPADPDAAPSAPRI